MMRISLLILNFLARMFQRCVQGIPSALSFESYNIIANCDRYNV
jgi:hypothetical protein